MLQFVLIAGLLSQDRDSAFRLTAVVYDESFNPVPATHIINVNSHLGDISDSLGFFSMPVHSGDSLFFRNIAYREILVPVALIREKGFVLLKDIYYPLQEAKVFPWGSSYEDFSSAMINAPVPQTLAESLGLPRQDPDYIPFEMQESNIKSVGFLVTSPISYIYYNLSKKEKSRRKLFWSEREKEKYEAFDAILSPENLSQITGLRGDPLLEFMAFLFKRLVCDYRCSELQVYAEIYSHWEVFQQIFPELVPDD